MLQAGKGVFHQMLITIQSSIQIPNLKYVRYCAMTRDTLKAISLKEEILKKLKGQDVKM
jgi:hypothetical protein